ncbi:hypothetical protein ACLKA7_002641 [Drosophila subpalustris]
MRFLLLFNFIFVSVVSGTARVIPARDRILLNELKTLGENLLNVTLNSQLDSRLKVAQLIIDSNVAQQSVIEGMQSFITKWRPVAPRVGVEDYAKFSVEFPMVFGLEILTKYQDEDAGLNYFTRGAFSAIKSKVENDDRQRLTLYKDIAVPKMAELSQETKDADKSLMDAFDDFVNQKDLQVVDFFTFLRALRKY